MPDRQIPVLIDSIPEKAEGFIASIASSDRPMMISVKRLLPSIAQGLTSPEKRQDIEKEYGTIGASEWKKLRDLLSLMDRMNAGDRSLVTNSNTQEVFGELSVLMDKWSPGGWFQVEGGSGPGKLRFRSTSGGLSVDVSLQRIDPTSPRTSGSSNVKSAAALNRGLESGGTIAQGSNKIHLEWKTLPFAVSEALTAGLKKSRFVVWWSEIAKKLVPGLYCPDILTALCASIVWVSGVAGGWAICENCKNGYSRRRVGQRHCTHKCQVAAAMRRYRKRNKSRSKLQVKTQKHNRRKKAK
jgi:hypothetical protein